MPQIFYYPDAAKEIALAKTNNGQLSVVVPVELNEMICQDPEGFDCYVAELIFGKQFIVDSKVRVLGYDADNVYSPCGVDTENRILLLVTCNLHPEYLKPENEDGYQIGDAATVRELYYFSTGGGTPEIEKMCNTVKELYHNRSYTDETLPVEFKAIAQLAIRMYAKIHADREWGRETLGNDNIVRMLSWELQQHFMEE